MIDNPFAVLQRDIHRLEAKQDAILELLKRTSTPSDVSSNIASVCSKRQIQEMTGWPDGTFYAKVREMPEGVVIRGKSKRLLFNRAKFVQWLQTPVQP